MHSRTPCSDFFYIFGTLDILGHYICQDTAPAHLFPSGPFTHRYRKKWLQSFLQLKR